MHLLICCFNGRTGYGELPPDRCDRTLYFDPQKGKTGKSYTTLGGTVPERPLNRVLCPLSEQTERLFDTAHVQFAEVAATAWRNAELLPQDTRLARTGMYVGHSGGTKSGGGLSLGTQIEEALSFVDDIDAFRQLPANASSKLWQKSPHRFAVSDRHVVRMLSQFSCLSGGRARGENSRTDRPANCDRCGVCLVAGRLGSGNAGDQSGSHRQCELSAEPLTTTLTT